MVPFLALKEFGGVYCCHGVMDFIWLLKRGFQSCTLLLIDAAESRPFTVFATSRFVHHKVTNCLSHKPTQHKQTFYLFMLDCTGLNIFIHRIKILSWGILFTTLAHVLLATISYTGLKGHHSAQNKKEKKTTMEDTDANDKCTLTFYLRCKCFLTSERKDLKCVV